MSEKGEIAETHKGERDNPTFDGNVFRSGTAFSQIMQETDIHTYLYPCFGWNSGIYYW